MKNLFGRLRKKPVDLKNPSILLLPDDGLFITKTWGYETVLTMQPGYTCKKLSVMPGYTCSLHMHPVKNESFYVLSGGGFIEVNGTLRHASKGTLVHVPNGTFHRFMVLPEYSDPLVLLEVSTAHSDRDVVRRNESHRMGSDEVNACRQVAALDIFWPKVLW